MTIHAENILLKRRASPAVSANRQTRNVAIFGFAALAFVIPAASKPSSALGECSRTELPFQKF